MRILENIGPDCPQGSDIIKGWVGASGPQNALAPYKVSALDRCWN